MDEYTQFLIGGKCGYCHSKKVVGLCSGCHKVGYCGPVCQKKAWPIHKKYCKNLANPTKVVYVGPKRDYPSEESDDEESDEESESEEAAASTKGVKEKRRREVFELPDTGDLKWLGKMHQHVWRKILAGKSQAGIDGVKEYKKESRAVQRFFERAQEFLEDADQGWVADVKSDPLVLTGEAARMQKLATAVRLYARGSIHDPDDLSEAVDLFPRTNKWLHVIRGERQYQRHTYDKRGEHGKEDLVKILKEGTRTDALMHDFYSTTTENSSEVAVNFSGGPPNGIILHLYLPPGTSGIYIQAIADLERDYIPLDWFMDEGEFLLAPGMMFLVVSVNGCHVPDLTDKYCVGVRTYHLVGYYPCPLRSAVFRIKESKKKEKEREPVASTSASASSSESPPFPYTQ
jgi:hypothetical protein